MKNDTVTRTPRRSCLGVSKPEGGLSLNRTSTLGRVLASMVALAVTSGISLGLSGQASAAPQSPAANPDQAKVAELQEQYKAEASPEDYQRAVDAYDQLVAGKATDVAAAEQPQGAAASGEEYAMCVSIPKWAVVAVAWYAMVGGGAGGRRCYGVGCCVSCWRVWWGWVAQ